MNSLGSLGNDQLTERSLFVKSSLHNNPHDLRSPQKTHQSQHINQFRLRPINIRQAKTHSIGYKPTSRSPYQLGSPKYSQTIVKDFFKHQQQPNSKLVNHRSQVQPQLLKTQLRRDKQCEGALTQRQDQMVILQKVSHRKTKLIKQQKQQDNDVKLQSNLRIQIPKFSLDVDTLMGYYNRKMKLLDSQKVFIFNSQDDYIRRVLIFWGWVENKIIDSPFYHLKWAYTDTLNDHKTIPGQIFNHFKNNQEMTSKGGLIKNMRNYCGFDLRIENYIPRSYNLGNPVDCDSFYYEYQKITMLSILKKHYQFIQKKINPELIAAIIEEIDQHQQKNQKRWRSKKYSDVEIKKNNKQQILKYEDHKNRRQDFLTNTQLLLICIRYCRFQRKNMLNVDWNNPKGFLNFDREQLIRSFNNVLKYSRLNHPVDLNKIPIASQNNFNTPSRKMIKKIIKYYKFYQSQNNLTWASDGYDNIWVIKPANNSRGNGIYLDNDCFEITNNSSQGFNRIVQKYIQNPLICNNPSYPLLFKKKFDIRQWVLVTSFNPLKAWMFSSCYLRICSQSYDNNDIKNLQRHLTNYSFNKSHFAKKQQSIESLQNFKHFLLTDHNVNWEVIIKPQIMTIIYNTLVSCADSISDTDNKFEMYGFDILIDQQFKPWLLQVNLSPACEQRTDFLKQYCESMGQQLLRIVLPQSYCKQTSLNPNQQKYSWQRLPQCFEEKRKQDLIVVGTQMNYKNQKLIDLSKQANRAAIVIQSVFKMIKPKKQLKQLKKVKLSKQIERYFLCLKSSVSFVNYQRKTFTQCLQKYINTNNNLLKYNVKLQKYFTTHVLQKYFHTIHTFEKFRVKRLNKAIKNIQSIYQHYECLKIIVQHKYHNSMAKKIQRYYKKYYQQKIDAANILKKYLRKHIYQKKKKQFYYDLQVYKNKISIEKYLRSFLSYLDCEKRIQNSRYDLIQNGVKQLLATRTLMQKKLKIFEREVGRVLRVGTRRTRTYYFPDIKQYVKNSMKMSLNLQRYLLVYHALNTMKKKMRKRKTKIISVFFKSFIVQSRFVFKRSNFYINEQTYEKISKQKQQQLQQINNKKRVSLPKIQSNLQTTKALLKKKNDEQQFQNYLAKTRQIRRISRNGNKKY